MGVVPRMTNPREAGHDRATLTPLQVLTEGKTLVDADYADLPSLTKVSDSRFLPFFELIRSADEHRYRAVHKIQILNETSYRWSVSLDFRVPKSHKSEEPLFVPLHSVPIAQLSEVDLRAENAEALPAVTRRYEFNLLSSVCMVLWAEAFDALPDANQHELLRAIVWYRREKAEAAMQRLATVRPQDWDQDENQVRLWKALTEFSCNGVICAVLQDAKPGDRRIVKMAYTVVQPREAYGPLGQRALQAVLRNCGLATETVDIPSSDIASYYSVHYQVQAPSGLAFTSGSFIDAKTGRELSRPSRRVPSGSTLAHLYSDPSAAEDNKTAEDPVARLRMYPDSNGVFRRAVSTAWWLAWAVAAAALLLPIIQSRSHGSEVGAGFLAGAVGVSAVVLTSVDHAISWRMFRSARYLLGFSTVIVGLTGAMILGVDPAGPASSIARFCQDDIPPLGNVWSCVEDLALDRPAAQVTPDPSTQEQASPPADSNSANQIRLSGQLGALGPYRWWLAALAFVPPLLMSSRRLAWLGPKLRRRVDRSRTNAAAATSAIARKISSMVAPNDRGEGGDTL